MPGAVVLVATPIEARAIRGLPIITTGVGAARALAALDRALAEHRPDLVIHAGFAGGLDESLRPGALLRPSTLIDDATRARLDLPHGDGSTIITLPRVASVHEKPLLRRDFAAHAVDMEGFAVAAELRRRGVPFRILRAISDPATFALPPESERWVDDRGRPRVRAVLHWAGFRPARLALLWRLKRQGDLAAARLGEAVAAPR